MTVDTRARHGDISPRQWVKKRLFNSVLNSIVTVVLIPIVAYLLWRGLAFVLFTARWEPVRNNLTLFMTGRFPRDEMWRVVAQVIMWSAALGVAWGATVAGAKARALRAGLPYREDSALSRVRRYWAILLALGILLVLATTWGPFMMFAAALAAAVILQRIAARLPAPYVGYAWSAVAVLGVAGFQIVSGFYGNGWLWMGIPVAMGASKAAGRKSWTSLRAARWARTVAVLTVLVAMYLLYAIVDSPGIGWERWEGLRLNILAAPIAIVVAFPLGIGLALARRSSFPAFRMIATGYVELIRGVPLISLLLMGQFFIGFFLDTASPLSSLTRAFIALTMFTSAYIAEIIRAGLQSVPRGQIEAGQSVGLSPFKVMRRIVLPQALRNVIPPMVGQFIALTKDTTLLYIIALAEILYVRNIVHAQAAYRGFGIAETLVFVAFIFWAITFSMSRESQRLERKLGVGVR